MKYKKIIYKSISFYHYQNSIFLSFYQLLSKIYPSITINTYLTLSITIYNSIVLSLSLLYLSITTITIYPSILLSITINTYLTLSLLFYHYITIYDYLSFYHYLFFYRSILTLSFYHYQLLPSITTFYPSIMMQLSTISK